MRFFHVVVLVAVCFALISCFPRKTEPDKYPKINWLPGFNCTNKNIYFHTVIDSTEHIVDYYNGLPDVNLFFVIKTDSVQQDVYLKIADKKFNILEEKKVGHYNGIPIEYLINNKIFCCSHIIDCENFSVYEPEGYVLEDTLTDRKVFDYPENYKTVSSIDFIEKQYPNIIAVYDLAWFSDDEFLIMEKDREYRLCIGAFKRGGRQEDIIDSLLEKREKSAHGGSIDDFTNDKKNLDKFDDIVYESKFSGAGGSCVVLPVWFYSNKDLNYYRYYYKKDTLFFKEIENSNDVTVIEDNHLLINSPNGNRGLVQVREKES